MIRISLIILAVISLIACDNQKKEYSKAFYEKMKNSGIELHNDTLVFPDNAMNEDPIIIPTTLNQDEPYNFHGHDQLRINLRRVNFTDIEYKLYDKELLEEGVASLRPTFYLGTESIETSEGAFWVTDYEIEGSEYLRTIRIGNESLTGDQSLGVYIYTIPQEKIELKKLAKMTELWRVEIETPSANNL